MCFNNILAIGKDKIKFFNALGNVANLCGGFAELHLSVMIIIRKQLQEMTPVLANASKLQNTHFSKCTT